MKIKLPENSKVRIEMLPLIDVVFLLLVVFIYTMLSMAVHNGLPVVLPQSSTAEPETDLTLSVTIKANGDIFVNTTPVLLKDLKTELLNHLPHNQTVTHTQNSIREKNGVLVFADNSVSYQTLFNILDKIKEAGHSEISLQAEAQNQIKEIK